MKIFCFLFFLFFFVNCADPVNKEKREVILNATPERIVDLKGEKIPIQELVPRSMCRLDTFLIILNMEEEKILRVYQAETHQFLGAFLAKGRGDDEVITCEEIWAAPWKGKMRLWLKAPLNFVGVVDLESSLKAGKPCWEQQYDFGTQVSKEHLYRSVFPLNDSVFWISCAVRPSYIFPKGGLKMNPDGSAEIISEQGSVSYPPKNLYWLEYHYASSLAQDTIGYTDYTDLRDYDRIFFTNEAMSPDRQRIAVAFGAMNQVLLFDKKTLNSRWITTEAELPLPYSTESDGFHYSGVDCTDKVIFAYRAFPEDPRAKFKFDRLVNVFDWNGKFKYQLNVGHPLKCPFLDEEKRFLYAADEEDNIWRYDIKPFL